MKVKSCSDAEAQRTQLNLPKSNYSSDWVNVKRSAVNAVRLGVSHIRVSDVKSWITNCGARLIQIPSQHLILGGVITLDQQRLMQPEATIFPRRK